MKRIIIALGIVLLVISCSRKVYKEVWTTYTAPEKFKATLETTKGDVIIYAERKWSPKGVDRLYQLIKTGFFTDVSFYRTVPNFVAQFGISNDTILNNFWTKNKVIDEPVIHKNDSLTISFARSGKETRNIHLFINLKNNYKLDTVKSGDLVGFPVVAKIIEGGEVAQKLYGGYANKTFRDFDSIEKKGSTFLRKKYPKLDYIKKAYLLKE